MKVLTSGQSSLGFTMKGIPALQRDPDTVVRLPVDDPSLSLLLASLEDFQSQAISYCYWKSSRRVQAVLAGEGDLDLLISRHDQHRAQAILLGRGYKRFPCVPMRDHPAVESYLGCDEPSGRLIHLHLHFRLVVGERLHKNYRIPWETAVLARAISHPALPVRILDPASEAVLLAVRACLELRRLDPVTLRGWRTTLTRFALDRKQLAGMLDRAQLAGRASELLGEEIGMMLTDAIYGGGSLEKNRRLRSAIQRHFAPYQTYNALEARLRSTARALHWAAGSLNKSFLHLPRPWNRCAPGGGSVVALIGIDGSGKTSVNSSIRAWLGSEIDVMPVYFGTGEGRPSLLLRPFKLLVPLVAILLRNKPKGASHGKISKDGPGLLYSLCLMVWAALVAREKRVKLLAARRGASRGLIVLTDRYPQNEISGFNDGPLLTRLAWAPSWLRQWETKAYLLAQRLPPDLVIKLIVPPETIARREPDMDSKVVRDRIEAVPRLTFAGARVVSVNAEQPLADVIRTVKREIWRIL
jgi:thymidylate kinase